jgi:hypothetical protein
MSRPQRQRRDSHGEAGREFKTVNIVKFSNSSGHYFQLFRIDSMLPATAFYFFPAYRQLIPAHCLLCLFKTSGLAFLSSASGYRAGYRSASPDYLNRCRLASPPFCRFC